MGKGRFYMFLGASLDPCFEVSPDMCMNVQVFLPFVTSFILKTPVFFCYGTVHAAS